MRDEEYMQLAIDLAKATIGQTSPNPSVGCVIVNSGVIVGLGSHLVPGEGHAEALALAQAKEKAEGADVYVTLEPCSHTGKTPPCSEALIKHKVRRVVIATTDPNPLVNGKGISRLEESGIVVEVGLLEEEAREVTANFFHSLRFKRPFVTLKAAMTLDGKIATHTGDSKWITGTEAREHVHQERARHDAILVGKQTAIKDNPKLTVRSPEHGKNPIRILLDTDLTITEPLELFSDEAKTYVVCGKNADSDQFKALFPTVDVIQLDTESVEVEPLLKALYQIGVQSLYVEGGGSVHASFINEGLFDACHFYIAPKLLTGSNAIGVVGGSSPLHMSEAKSLHFKEVKQVGEDLFIHAVKRESI